MNENTAPQIQNSPSDNLKSKTCGEPSRTIQNRKLVGFFAILLAFTFGGVRVEAQQPGKVHRIGYLSARSAAFEKILLPVFLQGLRELGYEEGKDIVVERRDASQPSKLRELAAELVRLEVDVIVASGNAPIVKEATTTIPIVFIASSDPVGIGLVQSLARPGGNITGLSDFHGDLVGKRLELVKEVVPSASRIGFLFNAAHPSGSGQWKQLQLAAPAVGVTLLSFGVKKPSDFDHTFAAVKNERPGALVVHGNPLLAHQSERIREFMVKSRLPHIFTTSENVEAGGLMSYGTHFPDLWRRAAVYVDKILKGSQPADLPVEQPTKFELVINLKTAKQIGLTIPPSVLYRADKIIR